LVSQLKSGGGTVAENPGVEVFPFEIQNPAVGFEKGNYALRGPFMERRN
jgi:hypothetical protein